MLVGIIAHFGTRKVCPDVEVISKIKISCKFWILEKFQRSSLHHSSYISYPEKHSLWGDIWNDAPKSTNHDSWSTCILKEANYTSPPSSEVVLTLTKEASSDPFPFSRILDLQCFFWFPSFQHIQHTFIKFPSLDIPVKDLFLFLFWEHPFMNEAYPF